MGEVVDFEVLLGGEQEDKGFSRMSISEDDSLVPNVYRSLKESASENSLEEESVVIGDMEVVLNDNGVPHMRNKRTSELLSFSSWSFTQLSEKLGMGAAGYLKKCLTAGMNELVPENFNRWIEKHSSKELMFRTHTVDSNGVKSLRAIVSNRYGLFDHIDVVASLQNVLGRSTELRVDSSFMSPDNMSLRLVDPTRVINEGVGVGDGSVVGLSIRNGQTGQVSLEVEFMIYTLICTNGLFIGQDRGRMLYKKHYSIERADFEKSFVESIERFPDYIAAAHRTVEDARSVRLASIFDDEEAVRNYTKQVVGLSEDEASAVESIMKADWEMSLWGLSGAVTQFAQTIGSSERQYKVEQTAGKIITRGLQLVA
jgi:hypothetical protein